MKNLMIVFLLVFPMLLQGQEAPAYVMYRNLYITPEKDKAADFGKNLAAHNKTYHSGGAGHVNVWWVSSGANYGKFVWSQGPQTWSDIDARNLSDAHREDWRDNVRALADNIEEGGHWRLAPDHSYGPDGVEFSKLRIRKINVKRGENARFNQVMKKLAEAYKQKKPNQAHLLFNRVGATNDGNERVVVFGYNNWAEMESSIAKGYEEVHGEGSWDLFLDEIGDVFTSSDDELWNLVTGLSGNPD